ncbi:MAG: cation:proton antiporter [Rhodobacterales bacterium]|nr:cation:proton antiporter [Rhodobacterales bacterium]
MESLFLTAVLFLGAAVLVVPVAMRLGLGSVLGYLAAGPAIAPLVALTGADTHDVQHYAEFGVVLMLFLIGLELEPRALWDMRGRLVGLGGLQVGLTAALVAAALWMLGLAPASAVSVGLILALSSTAIVLQTLSEKNLMRSAGGRSTFAVLLAQDIAVVPVLAALPLLAATLPAVPTAATHGVVNPGEADKAEPLSSLVQTLPGWAVTALTLAVVAGIMLAGHFLSRRAFRFVHAARLPEMSTFFSLAIVVGIALAMQAVGLSPALGSFLAGVVLANSEFRHQIEADIRPFKGLAMGIFFMTVGAGIDLSVLASAPGAVLGGTLALILGKALVLAGLGLGFGLRGRDLALFALGLAQGGEFGFLLAAFAAGQGLLTPGFAQGLVLAISLSMLLTPALFLLGDRLGRRLVRPGADPAPDVVDEKGRVLIAGIGRFGQVVNRLVRTSGLSTTVLDNNPATIELMRRFGVKGFFGDPARPDLLDAAGLAEATVLVVAVDDPAAALRIVRHARARRPDLHIVARARDRVHVYELYQAGASDIVRETFDSAVRAGRYVLENAGFTDYEAARMSQAFWRLDRAGLRELAALWVPDQPVHLNAAYVAQARELDADLETALIEELQDERAARSAAVG